MKKPTAIVAFCAGLVLMSGPASAAGLGDPLLYDMLAFLGYAALYCMAGMMALATGWEYAVWRKWHKPRTRMLAVRCLGWTVALLALPLAGRFFLCQAGADVSLCTTSLSVLL